MSGPAIQQFECERDGIAVRGFLHHGAEPHSGGVVLTHGAGANCNSPLLVAVAGAFAEAGVSVLRCDLPFRQLRPHGPPPRGSADRDQHGLHAAVDALRKEIGDRIFLGGHSYGGRQASILAASEPGLVDALLLLSYPLHPPRQRDQLRTAHFPQLQTPALFASGARDGFATTEELSAALNLIPAQTELLSIHAAGHELMTSRNREELPRMLAATFLGFVNRI
ncbi:MAG TPA: alpha/beta fold hydrolase [Candidatus Acidoferrales bacterium]|nr:alpha/beta fold hydrolase [Candidatus Acidoferrales bacterium]